MHLDVIESNCLSQNCINRYFRLHQQQYVHKTAAMQLLRIKDGVCFYTTALEFLLKCILFTINPVAEVFCLYCHS